MQTWAGESGQALMVGDVVNLGTLAFVSPWGQTGCTSSHASCSPRALGTALPITQTEALRSRLQRTS
jgi:hypothetical protein